MSTEELLCPRYKVKNGWPGMRDFTVGQIVVLDKDFSPQYKMWEIDDCQGKRQYITKFFQDYPHLFTLMAWYEGLETNQFPEYVHKHQKVVKLLEVEYHGEDYPSFLTEGDSVWCPAWMCLPASESEYNNYINK